MVFRNAFRLLLSNFSSVWKVLVYYLICIALTVAVCYYVAEPIIAELSKANVFQDFVDMLNNIFYQKEGVIATTIETTNKILSTAWEVLKSNLQVFMFNYIFVIVWVVFVLPFMFDLAQLALGEVLYGFMTSQVKYGFTGRYIKNIGKGCIYSVSRYFVQLILNAITMFLFIVMVKFFTLGNILYVLLDILLLAAVVLVLTLKYTIFSCWMPGIAVLNLRCFKALNRNFKIVFKRFFKIFSNCLAIMLSAFVFNFLFFAYTFGIGLAFSLPVTVVLFAAFQMVTYFNSQGMRYYVYPDTFVSPKKFEEQDKIKKIKNLI